jgi:hypothetical protein
MKRSGYLREFLDFWTPRPEVRKVWFSLFTPQIGDDLPEMLTHEECDRAITELLQMRKEFRKLDMPEGLIRQMAMPPHSLEECVFALTTETISADLKTKISPCQFGGNPDCSSCGCIASMALAAVAAYKLGGGTVPVGAIFKASIKRGSEDPGEHQNCRKFRISEFYLVTNHSTIERQRQAPSLKANYLFRG